MNKIIVSIICCFTTTIAFGQATITSDPNQMLDKIERACASLNSFEAEMNYKISQPMIDDETIRTGKLYYQADDGSVLARIHFKDLLQRNLLDEEENIKPVVFDEDFYFDGLWVVRFNEQTKTVQRWEVARDRQDRDSFRLGKGPFPLPFAIKKADILKYFEVVLADDKNRSMYARLKLVPKEDSSYAEDYRSIEIWFNYSTYLPAKIKYVKQDYEENTVAWSNINSKDKIDDSIFKAPKKPNGWTEETTPLKD